MWPFSVVDKTNDIVCPLLEYTAYVFYINTECNRWKMHFNVTKKLDALIQVSPCMHICVLYTVLLPV